MKRRLVRVGRALAAALPAEFVQRFRLKKGDIVDVAVHPLTGAVTIRPEIRSYEDGKGTPRFRKRAEEVLRRHEALFRKLAKL